MPQRCPFAEWRPLGPQTEPSMRGHDIVCAHTMVGYVSSTDPYFRTVNGKGYAGTESHYGIGGRWGPDLGGGLDGKIWQWQDRNHEADANLEGSDHVISIETADNAKEPIEPWTPKQLDALVRLIAWECSHIAHRDCPSSWACRKGTTWRGVKVAIPPTLIADTKPGRRGIGYHRQGCPPSKWTAGEPGWLVPGGEKWSTSTGKDCPKQVRVDQLIKAVIPRVQIALLGEEDDVPQYMDWTQANKEALCQDIVAALLRGDPGKAGGALLGELWQTGIARDAATNLLNAELVDGKTVRDALSRLLAGN